MQLAALLANEAVVKCGVGIGHDCALLGAQFGLETAGIIATRFVVVVVLVVLVLVVVADTDASAKSSASARNGAGMADRRCVGAPGCVDLSELAVQAGLPLPERSGLAEVCAFCLDGQQLAKPHPIRSACYSNPAAAPQRQHPIGSIGLYSAQIFPVCLRPQLL